MPTEVMTMIAWCLMTSLVALAYGEYASLRQSRGRPISVKERFRNVLILFAIAFSITVLAVIVWTSLPLQYVFTQLRGVASIAFAPILLWYVFDLPLRLARHLSRPRKPKADAGHPLDGVWSEQSSFLDRIDVNQVGGPRPVESPPVEEIP